MEITLTRTAPVSEADAHAAMRRFLARRVPASTGMFANPSGLPLVRPRRGLCPRSRPGVRFFPRRPLNRPAAIHYPRALLQLSDDVYSQLTRLVDELGRYTAGAAPASAASSGAARRSEVAAAPAVPAPPVSKKRRRGESAESADGDAPEAAAASSSSSSSAAVDAHVGSSSGKHSHKGGDAKRDKKVKKEKKHKRSSEDGDE